MKNTSPNTHGKRFLQCLGDVSAQFVFADLLSR